MSNLESAKAAIAAEIAHAKQGVAHFLSRVEALEKALLHIVAVDGGILDAQPAAAMPVAKSKAQAKAKAVAAKPVKSTKTAKPVKPAKAAKGVNDLPFTGGDYWTDLLAVEPKSASEILDAAVSKLGFTPTKEQRQKLAGRMTFALNALVKAKKIQDSGSGRARRFFKA
jgi:hypothetical protein